ncbi:phagocyte signaling-impaired protein-like [Glossina fuscipes]|uniref:Phagocyte signaling-impaired protein-like n=1 Tax=Glossina fuscipes TaxID=7396 RepID=A0A9C5ZEK8_9MUSC|nr:phagocyte signaling-impaired protein-like [Glossina fuscipes]
MAIMDTATLFLNNISDMGIVEKNLEGGMQKSWCTHRELTSKFLHKPEASPFAIMETPDAYTGCALLILFGLETEREDSFQQEVEILRIRLLLLRLIASFVDLFLPSISPKSRSKSGELASNQASNAAHTNNEGSNSTPCGNKDAELIEFLSKEWLELFNRLRNENLKPLPNRFLVNLLPTRLHLLLEMPYEKFFSDLVQLVMQFYVGASSLSL